MNKALSGKIKNLKNLQSERKTENKVQLNLSSWKFLHKYMIFLRMYHLWKFPSARRKFHTTVSLVKAEIFHAKLFCIIFISCLTYYNSGYINLVLHIRSFRSNVSSLLVFKCMSFIYNIYLSKQLFATI